MSVPCLSPTRVAALVLLAGALLVLLFPCGDARAQQRWPQAGVSASGGVALGSERSFFHGNLAVPFRVGRGWSVGPLLAVFSRFGVEEGDTSDDRFGVGLEVQRAFGRVGPVRPYVGARGLHAFSEGAGDGLYGGVLAGVQYAPGRRLAVGLEAKALRGPEEFLFAPGATATIRF